MIFCAYFLAILFILFCFYRFLLFLDSGGIADLWCDFVETRKAKGRSVEFFKEGLVYKGTVIRAIATNWQRDLDYVVKVTMLIDKKTGLSGNFCSEVIVPAKDCSTEGVTMSVPQFVWIKPGESVPPGYQLIKIIEEEIPESVCTSHDYINNRRFVAAVKKTSMLLFERKE